MRDNQRSNEQMLIDILFEVVMVMHENKGFPNMTREQLGEWMTKQLDIMGFETTPVGSSWGALTKINRS